MATERANDPLAPRPNLDFSDGERGKHFNLTTPPPDLIPPSQLDIDCAIVGYEFAKASADQAKLLADDAKKSLILLIDNFGHCPANAPQSKRLSGIRNSATITRGTSITVHEPSVSTLSRAVAKHEGLFAKLFTPQTKHVLRKGAVDALKAVKMSDRRLEKLLSLFGQCFDVDTNEPSLKVSVIKPEKPAKTPRAGKAVA